MGGGRGSGRKGNAKDEGLMKMLRAGRNKSDAAHVRISSHNAKKLFRDNPPKGKK